MSKREVINYRLSKIAFLAGQGKKVLDIGYSQEPNFYFKNCNVTGFDNRLDNCPSNYSRIITGDCQSLDSFSDSFHPEEFDAVTAGEVIEHLEDPVSFLRNAYWVLKPGGRLILSTPNPFCVTQIITEVFTGLPDGQPRDHLMFFSQRWLKKLLNREGFSIKARYSVALNIPPLRAEFVLRHAPLFFSNRIIYECERNGC